MSNSQDIERRYFTLTNLEVRQAAGDEPPAIRGYAAVYNARSVDLGGFVEEIAPGAFTGTLAARPDVRATFNHDANYILGRTRAGTLHLAEDERGLGVLIIPPDTQWASDLVTSMQRGDIDQMSFAFRVPKGGDEWRQDGGMPLRVLREIDLADGDVAIVTYPAYPQTSAEARAKCEQQLAAGAAVTGGDEADGSALQAQRQTRKRKWQIQKMRILS